MASGIRAPITTGNAVYSKPRTVGAGPDPSTANATLSSRAMKEPLPLWVYEFSADFSATGGEAQSRARKEFFARFFTQPRYVIKGQTANQHQHQQLSEFIRHGMLMQVSAAPTGVRYFEAFTLRIEGRGPIADRDRNTKGGHMGWTGEGYIESIPHGGERFVNSPEFEFTFVLANATEGPIKILDATYLPQRTNSFREYIMSHNRPMLPSELRTGLPPSKPPKSDPRDKLLDIWGFDR